MTLPVVQCATCRHLHADRYGGNFCNAFPDGAGIPTVIIMGEHDHHKPYSGDHGIRYSPQPGTEPPDGGESANGPVRDKLVQLFRVAKALVTREAA